MDCYTCRGIPISAKVLLRIMALIVAHISGLMKCKKLLRTVFQSSVNKFFDFIIERQQFFLDFHLTAPLWRFVLGYVMFHYSSVPLFPQEDVNGCVQVFQKGE